MVLRSRLYLTDIDSIRIQANIKSIVTNIDFQSLILLSCFHLFKVTCKHNHIFSDVNLPEGTNDQAGQDAFNGEKVKASETRNQVYNDLDAYDWYGFQASTGLELKDKNVENFNVGEVDAYCSGKGAVVRKCDEADLNCNKDSCPCNKKEGEITKCSKFKCL